MEFCDECGAMMVPSEDEDGNRVLKCRSCSHEKAIEGELKVSQSIEKTPRDKIIIVEEESVPLPKTTAECPRCGHNEAYFWTSQTRRADEGATEFYRCTKCKHTWRNYGG
ncbi:MAG: transcription factor S [Candidatus Thorarchaeota archaeon]